MSKSPSVKVERTRHEILKVAGVLFRAHGIKEVSISMIMGKLGMTPGGFYTYFPSKESLASEVCRTSFSDAQGLWQLNDEPSSVSRKSALGVLTTRYSDLASLGHCPVLAFSRDATDQTHDQTFAQAYREGVCGLLNAAVDVALAAGKTREEALLHFASMLGAGLLMRVAGSERWAREVSDAVLDSADPTISFPSIPTLY